MDRQALINDAAAEMEPALWRLIDKINETLSDLVRVRHLDVEDASAISNAVHSAVEKATDAAKLADFGLAYVREPVGPGNKIEGLFLLGGKRRKVSIELHYAGPEGGTRKSGHQFAASDAEEAEFPGFELLAPDDVLLFLAYHVGASRGHIETAFLVFADKIDKKKAKLHRPEVVIETVTVKEKTTAVRPKGTTVKIKKPKTGETGDVRSPRKRGDDPSRS